MSLPIPGFEVPGAAIAVLPGHEPTNVVLLSCEYCVCHRQYLYQTLPPFEFKERAACADFGVLEKFLRHLPPDIQEKVEEKKDEVIPA